MTAENTPPITTGPKKRFIGKARAEALRKKATENNSGPNIEDGIITRKGINSRITYVQGHYLEGGELQIRFLKIF
jgi:hypothetical protein